MVCEVEQVGGQAQNRVERCFTLENGFSLFLVMLIVDLSDKVKEKSVD